MTRYCIRIFGAVGMGVACLLVSSCSTFESVPIGEPHAVLVMRSFSDDHPETKTYRCLSTIDGEDPSLLALLLTNYSDYRVSPGLHRIVYTVEPPLGSGAGATTSYKHSKNGKKSKHDSWSLKDFGDDLVAELIEDVASNLVASALGKSSSKTAARPPAKPSVAFELKVKAGERYVLDGYTIEKVTPEDTTESECER